MTTQMRALPVATDLTKPFWQAARQGKLVVQRCATCGTHQFFPRPFCLDCMSTDIEWVQTKGEGSIYTYTINRRGSNSFMNDQVPYVVAMVTLKEGVRLMGNIIDSPIDQVRIGARVRVVFEKIDDEISLPQFQLL